MNFKALFIIATILLMFLLIAIWQAINFKKILNQLKQNKEVHSDSRYFELKYQLQFIQFVGITIITIVGILGYTTINDVREDLTNELTERLDNKIQSLLDSISVDIRDQTQDYQISTKNLIENSIDTFYLDANRDFNNLLTETTDGIDRMLKERIDNTLEKRYKDYIDKTISGRRIIIREGFKTKYVENTINVVPYANLNLGNISSIPIVFISPTNTFDYQILKVSMESFSIKISNAKQDSVEFSIVFFLKDE